MEQVQIDEIIAGERALREQEEAIGAALEIAGKLKGLQHSRNILAIMQEQVEVMEDMAKVLSAHDKVIIRLAEQSGIDVSFIPTPRDSDD